MYLRSIILAGALFALFAVYSTAQEEEVVVQEEVAVEETVTDEGTMEEVAVEEEVEVMVEKTGGGLLGGVILNGFI